MPPARRSRTTGRSSFPMAATSSISHAAGIRPTTPSVSPRSTAEPASRSSTARSTLTIPLATCSTSRAATGVEGGLVWFHRWGRRLGTLGPPGQYGNPELSPDGGRVVLNRADGSNMDIWTIDVAQGTPTRLTFDPKIDHIPVWSPDGSRVVFDSHRSGAGDLYQKASNGTGPEELLLSWDESMGAQDWSRDGRCILFTGGAPRRGTGPLGPSARGRPQAFSVSPYRGERGLGPVLARRPVGRLQLRRV